jgi:hypothetical protein
MDRNHMGFLPAIGVSTLVVFYLIWAAMHDIAHDGGGAPEYVALAVSPLAFAYLFRQALRVLTTRERVVWLAGAGLLISLFATAAVSALVNPKYPSDPILGAGFLAAGGPALLLIASLLVREARRRRAQA